MNIKHTKPTPWRGNGVLRQSEFLSSDVEEILKSIAKGTSHTQLHNEELRKKIHKEIETGCGVVFHRSKLLEKLGHYEFRATFQAFCSWLGTPAFINKYGDYIKEVADTGARDSLNDPQRGHMTNQKLSFHSDRADITVLCCWSPAYKGGELRLRSSSDVVNQLEKASSRLQVLLRTPIAHDLRDESDKNYCKIPLLWDEPNSFGFRYIRKFNESVIRHGLKLSSETLALLDAVDAEINQPNAYAEISFKKGDLVLINNHTTLHMRTEFQDSNQIRRNLLRCWLSSEYTRELPESFDPIFHETKAGISRGGIR
ncbi:TauD/TfdA family dioxygenase [Acinetobacter oleivorans]|uniref:TauD/TfdA family dioxygenase n=1 Tax=Acinetobacter oleivorans TaxID=1148157 RepID=UPI001CD48128|nr:TauD/TfdA family dioxygenase [Acinetobacter oleivorans]